MKAARQVRDKEGHDLTETRRVLYQTEVFKSLGGKGESSKHKQRWFQCHKPQDRVDGDTVSDSNRAVLDAFVYL